MATRTYAPPVVSLFFGVPVVLLGLAAFRVLGRLPTRSSLTCGQQEKMVLAKLELKYSMRRPMLFNTDYVSDVRQHEGPLNVTIKRVDNFNATVDIKNAQNAMGYLEAQKAAPATTTEKAIGALDAESYQIRLRYTWEHTPRKYLLIAEVSETHAGLTRRLLTFMENRFRLLYPTFGASVEIS